MNQLISKCQKALITVDKYYDAALQHVRSELIIDGKLSRDNLDKEQHAAHGLSWIAAYRATLKEMVNWAESLDKDSAFNETEQLMLQIIFSEYCAQIKSGIPMSQLEYVRPQDLGLKNGLFQENGTDEFNDLILNGNSADDRMKLAQLLKDGFSSKNFGNSNLDETTSIIRDQFRKFVEDDVTPHAHEWHLKDELIPMQVIEKMSEMGVFGLTIPEEYGGLGMSRFVDCVVTEELARGYIPKIASGETLPCAVLTEPHSGSDMGSFKTRAVANGEHYTITGNKTWVTHGARSDVMMLLARTNPDEKGYKGLSMFLAEKQRGDDDNMFPDDGISGGEIEVLGYRGMKEYEMAFDGFKVKKENLLGEEEGNGFKQMMETFESARIQTAARALGVAQSAFETSMQYAIDRLNVTGQSLYDKPRNASKIVSMATEIMAARQLTYYAAREKDKGHRCDLEAGMAKMLAARVAWACADNGLQIHGGNGFALEYPISRILCDSRILNIFEGTAEIQADIVTRRLVSTNPS
jgi:(2S)-methylsuccinyl-CoA dehydrogenase